MLRSRLVKKARTDAAYLTYDAMPVGLRECRQVFAGDGKIAARITFYPPDKRHRDADNMVASIKSALDGIADALGVNDRRFQPSFHFEDFDGRGRVEVALSPLSPARQPLNEGRAGLENNQAEQCSSTARPTPETLKRSATDEA